MSALPTPASSPPVSSALTGDGLSLRSWLIATVMGAVLLAVLGCVVFIEAFARAHAERRATESLRQSAMDFRDALDRGMGQQLQEVRVLSQLELFQRHDDVPAMRRALNQIQLGFSHFAWLGVTDASGKVLASGGGLLEGVDVSKRPWWSNALRGTYVGDVHAAVLLEKLLPQQSEPWRFVDFAWPVRDTRGQVLGVFGVHLSWAWARQIKSELIDAALEEHGAEALVLGQDGTVLLGPQDLEGRKLEGMSLASEPGSTGQALRYKDGSADYFAVTVATRGRGDYPGLGWTVLLRKPAAVALADYYKLRSQIVMTAVLLIALSLPLAWWLARRLAAPLQDLTRAIAARRHLGGERMPHVGGYREAGLLSGALSDLSERQAAQDGELAALNASLERRVTERTAQLEAGERRLRTITDNLPALISYIDRERRLRFLNATFKPWMSIDPVCAVGLPLAELMGPAAFALRLPLLERALAGERVSFETQALGEGEPRLLRAEYIPDLDAEGRVQGIYTLAFDITAAKLIERNLDELSRIDPLTSLPNRRQFEQRLAEAMARSRRNQLAMALMFLDIDKFKSINDGRGHAAGDAVLQEFARRLAGCLRSTDMVARLGGDEFVIILEGLNEPGEPEPVAHKILRQMQQPFQIDEAVLTISTSIGIALYRGGDAGAELLMQRADEALYEAKAAGRGTFRIAPPGSDVMGL